MRRPPFTSLTVASLPTRSIDFGSGSSSPWYIFMYDCNHQRNTLTAVGAYIAIQIQNNLNRDLTSKDNINTLFATIYHNNVCSYCYVHILDLATKKLDVRAESYPQDTTQIIKCYLEERTLFLNKIKRKLHTICQYHTK